MIKEILLKYKYLKFILIGTSLNSDMIQKFFNNISIVLSNEEENKINFEKFYKNILFSKIYSSIPSQKYSRVFS